MGKKTIYVILLLFYFVGLYLRSSGTLNGFFAFTFDQGKDFLQLHKLVYEYDISLIGPSTGIDGVFHGVWWYWALAPIFWLWGGNPSLVVLSFNALSAFTVLIAFLLGKKFKNEIFGLVLAGIVAVSSDFVGTGAQLWHPNVVPILTLLLLLATWQFLQKKTSFVWIATLLGMLWEFEFGTGGLFVPAFILTAIIFKLWPSRKEIILSLMGFSIWFLPRLFFEIRNHFLQIKSLIIYIQNSGSTAFQLPFIERVLDRFKTIIFMFKDGYTNGNEIFAYVLLIVITLLNFSPMTTKKDSDYKKMLRFTLTLIAILVLGASIYPNALWKYYLIGISALFLPFVGAAFQIVINKNKYVGWLIFGFWFSYTLLILKPFVKSTWQGDHSVYKNQLVIVDEIYSDAGSMPFNIQVYSPSVIDYTYQYLFLWRGKTAGNYPDRNGQQSLVYTIVEPDKWHKILQENWLREREGDGTMVGAKCYLGGIDVAKKLR